MLLNNIPSLTLTLYQPAVLPLGVVDVSGTAAELSGNFSVTSGVGEVVTFDVTTGLSETLGEMVVVTLVVVVTVGEGFVSFVVQPVKSTVSIRTQTAAAIIRLRMISFLSFMTTGLLFRHQYYLFVCIAI